MKRDFCLVIAMIFVVFLGCADAQQDPTATRGSLRIINQSQYQISELRLHKTESYLDASNVLPEPMEIDGEYIFYDVGEWYITVFREKYRDGPLIAVTTANKIELIAGKGTKLQVFDESFRTSDDEWLQQGFRSDAGTRRPRDSQDSSVMTEDSGSQSMDASNGSMDAGTSTTTYQDAG